MRRRRGKLMARQWASDEQRRAVMAKLREQVADESNAAREYRELAARFQPGSMTQMTILSLSDDEARHERELTAIRKMAEEHPVMIRGKASAKPRGDLRFAVYASFLGGPSRRQTDFMTHADAEKALRMMQQKPPMGLGEPRIIETRRGGDREPPRTVFIKR